MGRYSSEIKVGGMKMGGNNPVLLQTMTNTDTLDVARTVEQCELVFRAGADLVRITAASMKAARNLAIIKEELEKKGFSKPLIADVHFNAEIAEVAATLVDKVRINPGNYVDKSAISSSITDEEYAQSLNHIQKTISPLIRICQKHGTAIRVGANHGSLSARILHRYGNTPFAMVESVMEFLRIIRKMNFLQLVTSMKASDVRIMIYSTRLLVQKMQEENMSFPVHLGVTEAGEGFEGRVSSAVGIGTLLIDDIGDTIRVSLSEAPENEIPFARQLRDYACSLKRNPGHSAIHLVSFNKISTKGVGIIGGEKQPVVISERAADGDFVFSPDASPADIADKTIIHYSEWIEKEARFGFPLFDITEFINARNFSDSYNFVLIRSPKDVYLFTEKNHEHLPVVLVIEPGSPDEAAELRSEIEKNKITTPFIIKKSYQEDSEENLLIKASVDLGSILCDGWGDGIWISNKGIIRSGFITELSYRILQALKLRITATEFISCPTCGRTKFDMLPILREVKQRLAHLTTLKIAVMGCIVNGPGEMADADYGCVGSGLEKVCIYKGKNVVKKDVPATNAVDALIEVIKENNDWK